MLWLWHSLAAVAPIRPLAWELPYAALKPKNTKEGKKEGRKEGRERKGKERKGKEEEGRKEGERERKIRISFLKT